MSFDYVSGSVSLSVEPWHHHFLSTQVQKPGTSPSKPFVFRNSSILSLPFIVSFSYNSILFHFTPPQSPRSYYVHSLIIIEQITLPYLNSNPQPFLHHSRPSPNPHTHRLPPLLSLISHAQQPPIQEPVHRHSPSSHHEPPPTPIP